MPLFKIHSLDDAHFLFGRKLFFFPYNEDKIGEERDFPFIFSPLCESDISKFLFHKIIIQENKLPWCSECGKIINENNYKAKFINGNKDDLDLVYLIMKYSPKKYDLDKLNEKFKIVNKHFSHKLTSKENMSKLDSTYYKYNILYGSNSSST